MKMLVLFEVDELAPILDATPDGEYSADYLYEMEFNRRLTSWGMTALAVELAEHPTGAIRDALAAVGDAPDGEVTRERWPEPVPIEPRRNG